MKRVAILLAHGCEEIEAVVAIDVFRRGGLECLTASIQPGREVTGRSGICVAADALLPEIMGKSFDLVYIPGGAAGARNLREHSDVDAFVRKQADCGAFLAAICAGPTVLANSGLLDGATVTSHPTVRDELEATAAAYAENRVLKSGRILTSRGPGTAEEFALSILELLASPSVARQVAGAMVARDYRGFGSS